MNWNAWCLVLEMSFHGVEDHTLRVEGYGGYQTLSSDLSILDHCLAV
jgi:hypothetical protein